MTPTSKTFLELDARQFFDHVVRDRLAARAVVEGPNFFFGHNRSGNVEVLRLFCAEAHMPFEVTEPVEVGGRIVSSSGIRSLVAAGRLADAGRCSVALTEFAAQSPAERVAVARSAIRRPTFANRYPAAG